ncbi:MAG: AAA family ATPase [Verrucomicrobiota bacterium]
MAGTLVSEIQILDFAVFKPGFHRYHYRVLTERLHQLRQRLVSTVLGAEGPANLLLTALLAKGHALIEGPPGIGKTSIAHSLATGIGGTFKRIQFTPDLLPSDILGYNLYRAHTSEFTFVEGPVFAHLVLADEINRTSPRVQSALLEAMNEGQVTIDGETRSLEAPFMVIATQNNTSTTGTFPLPEPQLDRFLLSIPMSLPSPDVQARILQTHASEDLKASSSEPLLGPNDVVTLQRKVPDLTVSDELTRYVVALSETLRRLAGGEHTVSVRGSIALLRASQARALIAGETATLPEHVQEMFPHVMRHRLICEDGSDPELAIAQALEQTKVS